MNLHTNSNSTQNRHHAALLLTFIEKYNLTDLHRNFIADFEERVPASHFRGNSDVYNCAKLDNHFNKIAAITTFTTFFFTLEDLGLLVQTKHSLLIGSYVWFDFKAS